MKFLNKIIFGFLFFAAFLLQAQPNVPSDPFPIDEEQIPVDGGLSLLIGSGIAAGIGYRLRKYKK